MRFLGRKRRKKNNGVSNGNRMSRFAFSSLAPDCSGNLGVAGLSCDLGCEKESIPQGLKRVPKKSRWLLKHSLSG
jgi:hypothetical protein